MSDKKIEPIILDKYVLFERIGKGGRGEVYLARQITPAGLGKFVAIKRILEEYVSDKITLALFESEAHLAIKLKHNNIVSMLDIGCSEGQHYISMDFVEGQTLHTLLQTYRQKEAIVPLKYSLFYASCVALALEYARRATDADTGDPLRIVHRDISPHNIMINYEGEVKVIDFGVAGANLASSEASNNNMMGKFGYMSPEQAMGRPVDHRSDLFSLGIVFWEMLSGERMFSKMSAEEARNKIINFSYDDLEGRCPKIPKPVERILKRLLEKNIEDRYQRSGEVYKHLNFVLSSEFPGFTQERSRILIRSVFSDEMSLLRQKLIGYSKLSVEWKDKVLAGSAKARSEVGIGEVVFRSMDEEEGTPVDTSGGSKEGEKVRLLDENRVGEELSIEKSKDNDSVLDAYHHYNPYANQNSITSQFGKGLLIVIFFFLCIFAPLYFTEIGSESAPIQMSRRILVNQTNKMLMKSIPLDNMIGVQNIRRGIASATGSIVAPRNFLIQSSPRGAKVYVNGVLWEVKTPTYISFPKEGDNRIELEMNGYKSFSGYVSGRRKGIHIRLTRGSN